MKLLITGATGYLGRLCTKHFCKSHQVLGIARHASVARAKSSHPTQSEFDLYPLDLTAPATVDTWLGENKPDVIIHLAGFKQVAACERQPRLAFLANTQSLRSLLWAGHDAPIIYVSTDYVFCGLSGQYSENHALSPRTTYGRSKAAAELEGLSLRDNFYVLRTSGVFDRTGSFVTFLRRSFSSGERIPCFADSYYSPTFYRQFLETLGALISRVDDLPGRVFHACGKRTSRYNFAQAYAAALGVHDDLVYPVSCSDRQEAGSSIVFPDLSLDGTWSQTTLALDTWRLEHALATLGDKETK